MIYGSFIQNIESSLYLIIKEHLQRISVETDHENDNQLQNTAFEIALAQRTQAMPDIRLPLGRLVFGRECKMQVYPPPVEIQYCAFSDGLREERGEWLSSTVQSISAPRTGSFGASKRIVARVALEETVICRTPFR